MDRIPISYVLGVCSLALLLVGWGMITGKKRIGIKETKPINLEGKRIR